MARGSVAKEKVIAKIKEVFGNDYIGENANKHYVWAMDSGERVQIAISLTCPKVPLVEANAGSFDGGIDFTQTPVLVNPEPVVSEISDQEKQNLEEMMARLGL